MTETVKVTQEMIEAGREGLKRSILADNPFDLVDLTDADFMRYSILY